MQVTVKCVWNYGLGLGTITPSHSQIVFTTLTFLLFITILFNSWDWKLLFNSQSHSLIVICLYQVQRFSILKMCGAITIPKCIAKCVLLMDSIISLSYTQRHLSLPIQVKSFQVFTRVTSADNWPSEVYRVSRLKYHQCRNLNLTKLVLTRL